MWLIPVAILLPGVVLGVRGLRHALADPGDVPALLSFACAMGTALPLAHPALWTLLDGRHLTATDLLGFLGVAVLVGLLAFGCGLQAARGGGVARLLGGAALGAQFAAGDLVLDRIAGLGQDGGWPVPGVAAASVALAALSFWWLGRGRRLGASALLLAALGITSQTSWQHAGAGLAEGIHPLLALSLLLGLGFAGLVALLAHRSAERRVAALREDVAGWLAQMAEATPEAMAVLRDGVLIAANAPLLALLDQPAALVRGRVLADLFPREGQAWLEAALQGRLVSWGRARLLSASGLGAVEVAIQPLRGAAVRCHIVICRDLTAQLETEARIRYLTRHDALTGLVNRAELLEILARRIELARHDGTGFAVLQIGMDGFKIFNDVHGHAAGDVVLREVAQRLAAAVGPETPAARAGGDEFVVFLPLGEGARRADRAAERLLAILREPYALGSERLQASASIGLAVFPHDAGHANELLAMADLAMQRAKAEGAGRLARVDPERDAEARAARVLEQDLRLAAQNRQLRVWLQPQARTQDYAPIGFEALLRWQHPVHGLIPPDRFIPIAEAGGLMHEIGHWILREGMRQAAGWPQPLRIAINVSPLQLLHGDLPELIRAALEESGLAPERLEVEITESVLIDQGDAVLRQLHEIRALGVRISLDDFGTGYSSLGTLRAFPFDKLKMDRSFLTAQGDSRQADDIIRAVLALGRSLDMTVVAEGVETAEHCDFLRREGCDLLQGYLLGQPGPAERFRSIIENGVFDDEVAARFPPAAPSVARKGAGQRRIAGRPQAEREAGLAGELPPPAEGDERRQQERGKGDAAPRPVGPRPRQHARPLAAPDPQKHGGREGDGQRPAEILQVDGREDRPELHVAPAQQAPAPGRPKRQQPDAALQEKGAQRRLAEDGPAQGEQAGPGQDGGVGNPVVALIPPGRHGRPGRPCREPKDHDRIVSMAAGAPIPGAPAPPPMTGLVQQVMGPSRPLGHWKGG